MKFEKDKLVRDRIPEVIARNGKKAKTRRATDAEYPRYLQQKLLEEVQEFLLEKDPQNRILELVDIWEVIEALGLFEGLTLKQLYRLKKVKQKERGAFRKRIVLEEVPHD